MLPMQADRMKLNVSEAGCKLAAGCSHDGGPCSTSPSFSCSSRLPSCCAASFGYIVRHSRLSLPARCSLSRFMTYNTRSRVLFQADSIQYAERNRGRACS